MGDRSGHDPPGRHGGRRRSVNVREVLNGILLLAFGATCSFVTILFSCAWLYAIRRNIVLKRQIHSLTDKLAVVQQKYESEVKWRITADRIFGTQPARSVQSTK
jgi:hypothetical protein